MNTDLAIISKKVSLHKPSFTGFSLGCPKSISFDVVVVYFLTLNFDWRISILANISIGLIEVT